MRSMKEEGWKRKSGSGGAGWKEGGGGRGVESWTSRADSSEPVPVAAVRDVRLLPLPPDVRQGEAGPRVLFNAPRPPHRPTHNQHPLFVVSADSRPPPTFTHTPVIPTPSSPSSDLASLPSYHQHEEEKEQEQGVVSAMIQSDPHPLPNQVLPSVIVKSVHYNTPPPSKPALHRPHKKKGSAQQKEEAKAEKPQKARTTAEKWVQTDEERPRTTPPTPPPILKINKTDSAVQTSLELLPYGQKSVKLRPSTPNMPQPPCVLIPDIRKEPSAVVSADSFAFWEDEPKESLRPGTEMPMMEVPMVESKDVLTARSMGKEAWGSSEVLTPTTDMWMEEAKEGVTPTTDTPRAEPVRGLLHRTVSEVDEVTSITPTTTSVSEDDSSVYLYAATTPPSSSPSSSEQRKARVRFQDATEEMEYQGDYEDYLFEQESDSEEFDCLDKTEDGIGEKASLRLAELCSRVANLGKEVGPQLSVATLRGLSKPSLPSLDRLLQALPYQSATSSKAQAKAAYPTLIRLDQSMELDIPESGTRMSLDYTTNAGSGDKATSVDQKGINVSPPPILILSAPLLPPVPMEVPSLRLPPSRVESTYAASELNLLARPASPVPSETTSTSDVPPSSSNPSTSSLASKPSSTYAASELNYPPSPK